MTNILKSKIAQLIIAGVLAFSAIMVIPMVASAATIQDGVCSGAADLQFGGSSNCSSVGEGSAEKVNNLITQIVNIFSVIVGIVAVIMIVYGGFRYITSGGESGNVTNAKNTILYALIGLVIVALAQFIVKFVLAKATGLDS